jgi:hypothetical protein
MEEGATPFPVLPQPDLDRVAEVPSSHIPNIQEKLIYRRYYISSHLVYLPILKMRVGCRGSCRGYKLLLKLGD